MKFLATTGAENVTEKFDNVIMYGFIANILYILSKIFQMSYQSHDGRIKQENSGFLVCADVMILLIGFIQFGTVVAYRFSHTG